MLTIYCTNHRGASSYIFLQFNALKFIDLDCCIAGQDICFLSFNEQYSSNLISFFPRNETFNCKNTLLQIWSYSIDILLNFTQIRCVMCSRKLLHQYDDKMKINFKLVRFSRLFKLNLSDGESTCFIFFCFLFFFFQWENCIPDLQTYSVSHVVIKHSIHTSLMRIL